MTERILSLEEIDKITTESNDPKYQVRNLLHLGLTLTSIMRISAKAGLILIRGNRFTGFDHILERHSSNSKAAHWKVDKKVYLENPSRFSLDTTPIYDYLHIAESVYLPENLVTDENKRPDLFDLYIGLHTDKEARIANYKLVLYKNSKIIHSLFPTKKTFNKKKVLNLRQGFASSTSYAKTCIDIYTIPYFDINKIELFTIVICLNKVSGSEKWAIQINTSEGIPFATYLAFEKKVKSYIITPFRLASLDYHENMSVVEKTIQEIIDGKIKIDDSSR